MVFSSLEFICVFLPVVFILYCMAPGIKTRNALLVLASLLFYAYGEPVYVLLMIGSVLVNYLAARAISAYRKHAKWILAADLAANIAVLGVFKYAGFAVETLNALLHTAIPVPSISLPIGISFFTFQAMSYVIDVYRKDVEVQKSFPNVLLYISFFPQLIAGPIVRYKDICQAIEDRRQDIGRVAWGFERFIFGLGKKVLIANTVGEVADAVFAAEASSVNIAVAWLGAIAYMLQIYYDFSGYSDMAIGLGEMFGFHFRENFRYPYGAAGMKDFWNRWHISLSAWFKEYVYIPLGGNRRGKLRACVNRIIVFFLTGLWHGASWTFVIWGLWHGFFLLLEEYLPFIRKMPKCILRVYTLLVVCLGFVIFRADTLSQGLYFISQMFTGTGYTAETISFAWQQLTPWFIFIAVIGILGAAPIRPLADRIRSAAHSSATQNTASRTVAQFFLCAASLVILCWCIIRLSGNTYNPFIYFRF
ncbi:MAG: MBOAT family protein [Lachnospiraceae bacterium]|nr:MBOAT family protein [Lachnospiraceae bacterium]